MYLYLADRRDVIAAQSELEKKFDAGDLPRELQESEEEFESWGSEFTDEKENERLSS